MRFLYVMDPLATMTPDKDTTFALMRAAQSIGHQNLHCLPHELSCADGRIMAQARIATIHHDAPFARAAGELSIALDDVDAVLIRKDPPFDLAYLHATQLLECARGRTLMINDPRGLRDANEKLFTLMFSAWTPKTLVTADRSQIRAFIDALGGQAVIKPLDGAGGRGVLLVRSDDLNTPSIIDLITEEGRQLAIVQQFIPAVKQGDKRVLLLDGRPLGAILRVPKSDDLRANIHVGGSVQATTLTPREEQLVAAVGPILREHGLFFVGLDLIGEHLTEVNVTSPTGIQELGRLTQSQPEMDVIHWIEKRSTKSSSVRTA